MSNDPYQPPSAGGGFGSPTGGGSAAAAEKIKVPAIGLVVGGGLSILMSLYSVFNGVMVMFMGNQIVQDPNAAQQLEQMKQQTGMDPTTFFQAYGAVILVWSLILLVLSVIIIIGAVKMMQLNSRKLAFTSAILSIIPCTTGCCFVGLPFGIWALVVMNDAAVKNSFRS